MREKVNDPEWGKIPEYSVTFTAPGCPPGTPEKMNLQLVGWDKVAILGGIL